MEKTAPVAGNSLSPILPRIMTSQPPHMSTQGAIWWHRRQQTLPDTRS
jgi:hypothetical protein